MSNNQQNANKVISMEPHKRKYSAGAGSYRNEPDLFKVPHIADLDVSLIEKNPSHASSFNKTNNEPMLSPFLRNVSNSPIINKLHRPPTVHPNPV